MYKLVMLTTVLLLSACAENFNDEGFIKVVNGGVKYPPKPELVLRPDGKIVRKP